MNGDFKTNPTKRKNDKHNARQGQAYHTLVQRALKTITMEDFIKTINIYDYERFRARVIGECNVSTATWSNWRNSKNEPEQKYKDIIDRIATEMFGAPIYAKGGEA